jgi:c-di-AMP phosphodiesterase-like protein
MEQLGGGGHHSMAAAQLSDMTAEEAFALLKEKIDAYLSTSTDIGG